MSLATATQTYESKAKVKAGSIQMQPVLKTLASPSRENRREAETINKATAEAVVTGWEYFLNPLEYE